jgi:hypothetical protein
MANSGQTISLRSAQDMIGDVSQTVTAADAQFTPRSQPSSGTTMSALLKSASSNRRTNAFLEAASKEQDLDYRTFIKKAAESGVINNPRVLAYGEILKEQYSLKARDADIEKNKQLEEEQYGKERGREEEKYNTNNSRKSIEQEEAALFGESIMGLVPYSTITDVSELSSSLHKSYREVLNTKRKEDKEYKVPSGFNFDAFVKERVAEFSVKKQD